MYDGKNFKRIVVVGRQVRGHYFDMTGDWQMLLLVARQRGGRCLIDMALIDFDRVSQAH